jgi:hypothetical protein
LTKNSAISPAESKSNVLGSGVLTGGVPGVFVPGPDGEPGPEGDPDPEPVVPPVEDWVPEPDPDPEDDPGPV